MYTLEDYLHFRGDIDFTASPVNEIDEMVFAAMGKPNYSDILGRDEGGLFGEVFGAFFDKYDRQLDKRFGLLESPILMRTLFQVASSPRYRDIQVSDYINKVRPQITKQISALTVLPDDGKIYVTFRGTDDTLVGWKENFELSILDKVPAQEDALEYLTRMAKFYEGPIVVLGHSKGGNLAIYAAAKADRNIQARIEKVVSYDGPGFREEFLNEPGYRRIKNKVVTLVPRSSIVGMIMQNAGELEVIECEKEGPAAHDIFIWNIEPTSFLRINSVSEKSMVFHQAINQTLDKMDMGERRELINETFDVLGSTGAKVLMDLTENTLAKALKMSAQFGRAKEIKQFLLLLSALSIKGTMTNTLEELQEKLKLRGQKI